MGDWVEIDVRKPEPSSLVVFYVPMARYIWASGSDYDQIKAEYSTATHWKLIAREPGAP